MPFECCFNLSGTEAFNADFYYENIGLKTIKSELKMDSLDCFYEVDL